jgi:phage repressor protein C with HTH and peptisase S24 domain
MGRGFELEARPPGVIREWKVNHEWLRLNVGHYSTVENLCIVTGFGSSMRGMFNPGDPLLCDRGFQHVDVDGVYFFRVDSHGFIKILQRIPTERA